MTDMGCADRCDALGIGSRSGADGLPSLTPRRHRLSGAYTSGAHVKRSCYELVPAGDTKCVRVLSVRVLTLPYAVSKLPSVPHAPGERVGSALTAPLALQGPRE
jgi:hypothetical protein